MRAQINMVKVMILYDVALTNLVNIAQSANELANTDTAVHRN